MVALVTAMELLTLLQLSLNIGVSGVTVFQDSIEIYKRALVEQGRDLTAVELDIIRANNKKIRDDFLNLGQEPK